jgi:hypothetical protein
MTPSERETLFLYNVEIRFNEQLDSFQLHACCLDLHLYIDYYKAHYQKEVKKGIILEKKIKNLYIVLKCQIIEDH